MKEYAIMAAVVIVALVVYFKLVAPKIGSYEEGYDRMAA